MTSRRGSWLEAWETHVVLVFAVTAAFVLPAAYFPPLHRYLLERIRTDVADVPDAAQTAGDGKILHDGSILFGTPR